jgi:hypothetical protein
MGRPVKMGLVAISPESYLHFCTDIFFFNRRGSKKKVTRAPKLSLREGKVEINFKQIRTANKDLSVESMAKNYVKCK